jgi:F-type H+-transporting ATPase subunit b
MFMDIASILSTIGFDWRVALANFANFLLIFYLLKRFAFGPISRILDERKRSIEQGLEDARRAATERQMAEQEFARVVADAKDEANGIIASARGQEESILAKASEKHILNEAAVKIAAQRTAMEGEVSEKTAGLVVEGVEKIVKEKLSSADKQSGFIKRALV